MWPKKRRKSGRGIGKRAKPLTPAEGRNTIWQCDGAMTSRGSCGYTELICGPWLGRIKHPKSEGCLMILEVNKKQVPPDVAVLELKGRLLMGNDSRQVEGGIADLIKEGAKKVVADLRGLDAIDSTGVGILVMCNAKLQKSGGTMRIVSTDGIVENTLQMTHVDRIVKFYPTVEEASEKFETA